MKSKQSIVFNIVKDLYCPYIVKLFDLDYLNMTKLKAISNSPEQYHLIANAANKFYELVALNDEKT